MSNILITGGAGFIGSHLAEMLVGQGNNVTVIDNLFLGTESNLAKIRDSINFYKHNYEDKAFLDSTVKKHRIEYIFHFAGLSSAPMFDGNEPQGVAMNVVGFLHLLEVCRDNKVRRLMYASSSSIYGDAPLHEENVKVYPPNFYALTKYTMEHAARLFHDLYKVESIGFRFFSVYGKNERHKKQYANLVSQFLWAIQEGKEVVIYGDGSQTRDFIYVLDLCSALISGMNAESRHARAGVYNLGTSDTYSLNEMVALLEEATGMEANRQYVNNPIRNYVAHTKADCTKSKNALAFEPEYSLKQGIMDMLG
jgi:UDP-glucose 4-epimerase